MKPWEEVVAVLLGAAMCIGIVWIMIMASPTFTVIPLDDGNVGIVWQTHWPDPIEEEY